MKKAVVIIVMICMIVAAWGQEGQFYRIWKNLTEREKSLWLYGAIAGVDMLVESMDTITDKGVSKELFDKPDTILHYINELLENNHNLSGHVALMAAISIVKGN